MSLELGERLDQAVTLMTAFGRLKPSSLAITQPASGATLLGRRQAFVGSFSGNHRFRGRIVQPGEGG